MRTSPVNLREVLGAAVRHVRSGRANSRSTLAVALGLAPTTVGLYVDQLIDAGICYESGLDQGQTGRPKRVLATQAEAGWFAGVEFNADRMHAVRVNFSGGRETARVTALPPGVTPKKVLKAIQATVEALQKTTRCPLLGIGIGAPGIVDTAKGVSSHYRFLEDWNSVPVAEAIREDFGVPVTVDNNLRAIAFAERWFGGGGHLDNYVILGPRAGFGVASVQGGVPMRGSHHAAGEIGHWPWLLASKPNGEELQDALSAAAVWRRLSGAAPRAAAPADLREALAGYDSAIGSAWDEVVADFGRVVGILQLLIDTERFFLHGPLTALGLRFCIAVERAARAAMPALAEAAFSVVPSSLGDDAGALGAASLAMEAWAPAPTGAAKAKLAVVAG